MYWFSFEFLSYIWWWEELYISAIKYNCSVISANICLLSVYQVYSSQCCYFVPLSSCADKGFCRNWLLRLHYARIDFSSLARDICKNYVVIFLKFHHRKIVFCWENWMFFLAFCYWKLWLFLTIPRHRQQNVCSNFYIIVLSFTFCRIKNHKPE